MPRPLSRLVSLLPLLSIACSHGHGTPATTVAPQFVGTVTLQPNANAWVPLAAIVSLGTDVPTRVELRIADGQRSWEVVADPQYATAHPRVPVLGLRPDRAHTIEVLVRDQGGNVAKAPAPLAFTTPALPASFPPIEVLASNPQAMQPGVTLLSLVTDQPGSLPTMVDAAGEVVWYLDCSLTPIGQQQTLAFPLDDGHLLLVVDDQLLVEVDLLGDVVAMFHAENLGGAVAGAVPVATDSFHHDVVVMPEGSDADYAVLGTELRQLPDYPIDVVDPQQTTPVADVVGDEIVEFRRDGSVVRRFRLLDLLDPYRVSYDSLGTFWDDHYGRPTFDWSHANALALDRASDSWLVSLRHQDAVVKIQRQTGQVEWILGDPARWRTPWNGLLLTPIGTQFAWPYHQHAVQLCDDGSIQLFDNGCGRAIPPTPQLPPTDAFSRAVRFAVDEVARTVQQPWVYGGPPGGGGPTFYSFFVSSAYLLPATGNTLVCDGGKRAAGGRLYGHLFEITGEAQPQTVFELYVRGDGVANTTSYFIYRAFRLPGLYAL